MSGEPFEVITIEPIRLSGPQNLITLRLMSPYVWRQAPELSMLVRAVDSHGPTTGSLWFATASGLEFEAHDAPLLIPGPEDFDRGDCEDPTLVPIKNGCPFIILACGMMERR